METPPDFKACSVVYCHADAQRMPELREIFAEGKFATVQAMDGLEIAMAIAVAQRPTFVLLGSHAWNAEMLDIAHCIRRYAPETHCIIQLPACPEQWLALSAIGASGYVCCAATACQMYRCLAAILGGEGYVCDTLRNMPATSFDAAHNTTASHDGILSQQELRILHFLAGCMNNQQIADALCLSHHTVKNHKSHIMQKMGFSHASEMYALARKIAGKP